jgi:hypothetical protein
VEFRLGAAYFDPRLITLTVIVTEYAVHPIVEYTIFLLAMEVPDDVKP